MSICASYCFVPMASWGMERTWNEWSRSQKSNNRLWRIHVRGIVTCLLSTGTNRFGIFQDSSCCCDCIDWGRLRTGCWGEYLELRGKTWQEAGEHCMRRGFITCTLHQVLLGWSNQWVVSCLILRRWGFWENWWQSKWKQLKFSEQEMSLVIFVYTTVSQRSAHTSKINFSSFRVSQVWCFIYRPKNASEVMCSGLWLQNKSI